MDVVDAPLQVVFVLYRMFPEPSLPNGSLAASQPRIRQFPFHTTVFEEQFGEPLFDPFVQPGQMRIVFPFRNYTFCRLWQITLA